MKPQKIDVEDALAQMRVLNDEVHRVTLASPGASPAFIEMQQRLYPAKEALMRAILDEFNRGESGTDIMLAVCHEIGTSLGILENDVVAEDVLLNPPPGMDMTKYDRYKPSAQHAMLHIALDLIDSVMHNNLLHRINEPADSGQVINEEGGARATIYPKEMKMN
jgi:hypothetical protein